MDFQHDIIEIDSADKIVRNNGLATDLKDLVKVIDGWSLQSNRIIMNQRDYEDILKWSGKM
jgi:hypothetical protein